MFRAAFISRTLPCPLAPFSQRVSVISCKIVTVLSLLNLLNGTAKGLSNKLVNYGQMLGLERDLKVIFLVGSFKDPDIEIRSFLLTYYDVFVTIYT